MTLDASFFELFGLPERFALDGEALDRAYRALQSRVHPDRFADAGDAEKRASMQWATHANEAYRTLKRPLTRAQYLLARRGHALDAENNTAMPADFLIEQMEWREAVQEAREGRDHHELERLHQRLEQTLDERYAALAALFDAGHSESDAEAGASVRKLMFLEKLLQEIDDAFADLDN
jgi:molecular chaperone HscB